jgi:hypothetical protein
MVQQVYHRSPVHVHYFHPLMGLVNAKYLPAAHRTAAASPDPNCAVVDYEVHAKPPKPAFSGPHSPLRKGKIVEAPCSQDHAIGRPTPIDRTIASICRSAS